MEVEESQSLPAGPMQKRVGGKLRSSSAPKAPRINIGRFTGAEQIAGPPEVTACGGLFPSVRSARTSRAAWFDLRADNHCIAPNLPPINLILEGLAHFILIQTGESALQQQASAGSYCNPQGPCLIIVGAGLLALSVQGHPCRGRGMSQITRPIFMRGPSPHGGTSVSHPSASQAARQRARQSSEAALLRRSTPGRPGNHRRWRALVEHLGVGSGMFLSIRSQRRRPHR